MSAGSYLIEIHHGAATLVLERKPGALATEVWTGDGEQYLGTFLDQHLSEADRCAIARSIATAWDRGFQHGRAAGHGDLQQRLARLLGLASRAEVERLAAEVVRLQEGR